MKILIISHTYIAAENRKNILALGCHAQVKVLLPKEWTDTVFPNLKFEVNESDDDYFNPRRVFYLSQSQYFFVNAVSYLRKFRPDVTIVEYNPWSLMFVQALLARTLFHKRTKMVCLVKKNTFVRSSSASGILKYRIAQMTARRVDIFIAASEMARQLLSSTFLVDDSRIRVVHHMGVDTSIFRPPEVYTNNGVVSIGYAGRLDSDKGVEDLVAAVADYVIPNSPNVKLKLLGRGRLSPLLREMAENWPWLEVHLPVPHAQVARFLRGLDIFVMPSRILPDHQEHDGHAVMEAMACGLATIGTRSGIITELLSGGAGYIVSPHVPEELGSALNTLIADADLRKNVALRGLEKARREFSLEHIAARKIEILNGLAT